MQEIMEIEDNRFKSVMEKMNVGVSKHLLDEDFTLIWANNSFYQQFGYSKEEYDANYKSLYDFLIENPTIFKKIKNYFYDTYENKKTELEYDIKMPIKTGEFIWFRMKGTIIKGKQSDIIYIIYSNINDLMLKQEKLTSNYKEKLDNFEWMMSEYTGNIYISDIDNYELLYLNRNACNTLGLPLNKAVGKKVL